VGIDFVSFYLLVQTNPINLIINKSDEMQIHEYEKFENTKGLSITANKRSICKTMAKIKRTKGHKQTVYKSLHRKLQIEQHEPH